ncbi:sulfotransferase family 2 domain-containing protein [Acidimangrovimonas pyrenivorans]|uniref:Sulfotransferase family 2 domain-containing protein n=1 Tax=Acidimangrovimonas pyrenivorans TaxID=2030798 RepID=A0ABV7AD90_9RHOB
MSNPPPGWRPYEERIPGHKSKDLLLRWVSRHAAERYRFGQLPALERTVLAHTIATADGRLAFIKNPKAGCTTIAHLLYRYDHGHDYEGRIHYAPVGLRADISQWRDLRDALVNAVSFSTVRQPESRAVSAFFDFFVKRQNDEAPKHLDRIEAFGFSRRDDLGYRFDVYLDYVEANLAHSDLRTDPHFRPQHINLGHGAFTLTHVGRVETLDADLQHVAELAGIELPRPDSLTDARKNRSGSTAFAPSLAQRRRIEALYARDYELYGY